MCVRVHTMRVQRFKCELYRETPFDTLMWGPCFWIIFVFGIFTVFLFTDTFLFVAAVAGATYKSSANSNWIVFDQSRERGADEMLLGYTLFCVVLLFRELSLLWFWLSEKCLSFFLFVVSFCTRFHSKWVCFCVRIEWIRPLWKEGMKEKNEWNWMTECIQMDWWTLGRMDGQTVPDGVDGCLYLNALNALNVWIVN